MKRIGLVGGMSWQSTLEYYRLLNRYTSERLGADHAAALTVDNVNIAAFRALIDRGEEPSAYGLLLDSARRLQSVGTEILILGANGAHRYYEKIQNDIGLRMVHIAEVTAAAISQQGLKKVGLLGVRATMSGQFYPEALGKYAIERTVPENSDFEYIDTSIFSELVHGKFLPATKLKYIQIMEKMIAQGAEGIILGCTEIPLLITQSDVSFPVFSTTEIHCRAAIEAAFQ